MIELFKNAKVGSVVTLSDIQTQIEFGTMTADFRIKDIKKWVEPNNIIKYTGYVCDYDAKDREEDQTIMIMVREIGEDSDMLVYYLDQEDNIENLSSLIEKTEDDSNESTDAEEEDDEEIQDSTIIDICIEDPITQEGIEESEREFDEDSEESNEEEAEEDDYDLVDSFEIDLHFDDASLLVKWDKKDFGSFFGVEYSSTKNENDIKTIAEYFTEDDTRGNPHCFVEWTGDHDEGWVEIWYGCEITKSDLEVY